MLCGLIATGLSILAGVEMLLGPAATNRSEQLADVVEMALFVFVGLGISWLADNFAQQGCVRKKC